MERIDVTAGTLATAAAAVLTLLLAPLPALSQGLQPYLDRAERLFLHGNLAEAQALLDSVELATAGHPGAVQFLSRIRLGDLLSANIESVPRARALYRKALIVAESGNIPSEIEEARQKLVRLR